MQEYDLSCIIGKDDISFSQKYDRTPRRKMKYDLFFFLKKKKKQGNMTFSSNILKRWPFQKGPRWDMIFLVLSGKVVFFSRKDGIFSIWYVPRPAAKKIKDDLIPQIYT